MGNQESAPEPRGERTKETEHLEERVSALESTLSEQLHKARRGTKVFMFVGGFILLFIIVYLGFLYWYVDNNFGSAEKLGECVQGVISGKLPEMARRIEDNLRRTAPSVVDTLFEELMKQPPKLRVKVEKWVTEKLLKDILAHMDAHLAPVMDKLIKDNMPEINEFVKLAVSKETAATLDEVANEKAVVELQRVFQKSFEKEVGEFLDKDQKMKKYFESTAAVKKKLDVILDKRKKKIKLTPEEEFEAQMITDWMIFIVNSLAEADKEMDYGKATKLLKELIPNMRE